MARKLLCLIDREAGTMKRIFGNKGYSLTEMLVVLAMIGVMVAIGIPYVMKMAPHYRLKNAAGEVASDLQQARMQAIIKRANYTATFSTANHTYAITPVGGTYGAGWRGIEIYLDYTDPDVNPLASNQVIFRTDGTAGHTGGTDISQEAVYLRNTPYNNERYRIRIIGTTGRVSAEKWTGVVWKSGF